MPIEASDPPHTRRSLNTSDASRRARLAAALPLLLTSGCAAQSEPPAVSRSAVMTLGEVGVYPSPEGNAKIGWRRLGPGGGGAQYLPTIKPGDPNTALIASDMSDAFLTRDGGKSFRILKLNGNVKSIAFDPAATSTLYAGTDAGTLFRSVNDGERWSLIYPSQAVGPKFVGDHADYEVVTSNNAWVLSSIMDVLVDPENHGRLFIAVGKDNNVDLLRSVDQGATWSKLSSLSGTTGFGGFVHLYLDPTSTVANRRLIAFTTSSAAIVDAETHAVQSIMPPLAESLTDASVGTDPATAQPILYATSGATYNSTSGAPLVTGAFRSLTFGQSWEEMKTGLDADYVPGTDLTLNHIAASPSDARTVYISALENGGGSFGIFKSVDAGATWSWALKTSAPTNKPSLWIESEYGSDWAGAPLDMRVSPTNPQVLYATDWGTTYRTINGGTTWENLYSKVAADGTYTSTGIDNTNSDEIVFDPFDKDHLALVNSSDIGLFESTNGGNSWKHAMNGVPASWTNSCYDLVFDPAVKGRAWSVWSGVHDLPRYRYIRQPYKVEAGQGGICTTESGIGAWQCTTSGLPASSVPTTLVLDPGSPVQSRTLYITVMGRGVYKSTDGGNTWAPKNNGIQGNGLNADIYAWDVVRAQNGTLYLLIARSARQGTISKTANYNVATAGALYRSTDGAESWHKLSLPAGVVFPNSLAVDPSNPNRAYLACWPQTIEPEHLDHHGGLYRTEDAGDTWANVFDDKTHVYGVTVDPKNNKRVYITTFEGYVLRSDDSGNTWGKLGGFDFKWAKNPILDPYDSHMLYVTTFGGGIWYGPTEGIQSIPEDVYPLSCSQ